MLKAKISRMVALILGGGILFSSSLQGAETFGLALQVEGEVFVTRDILEFEAQVEEVLMWGDEIETGDGASIQITFDSSFLSIGPNTLVSFEKEFNEEGEELYIMNLEEGSFRSKILNMGSRQFFEVKSEGGDLRVHGTDFVTSFSPENDAGFNVSVLHGKVAVTPPESGDAPATGEVAPIEVQRPAAPVMLTQNQVGGIGAGGTAAAVGDMSFAQADEIKGDLPIPGDDDAGLVMTDLGIENVEVETFVEEVKVNQNESTEKVPESVAVEVERVQQDIIAEQVGISLELRGSIGL